MRDILILLMKDLRSMLNLRRIAREQSLFKVAFILLFASTMLFGLFAVFVEGFRFLDTLGGVGLMLVSRLFALFFLGLGIMLVLSGIVTSYTTFFRSEETSFLLLKPLSMGQIAIYKFLQATLFASWAFFFTIIPFIGAYAWHERLPLLFSLWTFVYSIPLVLLCCGVGAIICMLGARWLPRGRGLAVLALVAFVVWASWMSRVVAATAGRPDDSVVILSRLIPGVRVASNPLWPSWWVAEGIMSLTRDQWGRGMMLLAVLVSNVLLVGLLVEATGRAVFFRTWERAQYAESRTRRRGVLLPGLERALGFLASDVRGLIVKDLRVFFRDPAQWSQGMVFFGLLGLYFLNLRNMRYHMLPAQWRNLITFLNVFSVSAVMCSFGSRFIYPQLSLEGQGFWIVGMAPTTMRRVLMAKFALAVATMMTVSVGLMYLSTRMLRVDALVGGVALGIAVAMSFVISALSTGLGALFMDLRQKNPAAIVSGFGGTLNLVLSLGFMFCLIFPFGLVFHSYFGGHFGPHTLHRGLAMVAGWVALITVPGVVIPLALGARSLRRREY